LHVAAALVVSVEGEQLLVRGRAGVDLFNGAADEVGADVVHAALVEAAGEVFLLVDSSKFGRRSLGVISDVKHIDKLITTKRFTDEEFRSLLTDKVEVYMV